MFRFFGFDVIAIGTATRDVFLQSKNFRPVKDERFLGGQAECFALGAKLEVERPVFANGGGALNAAVTFSRQGLKTAALIRLGSDNLSNQVIEEMMKERIRCWAQRDQKLGTAYATILLSPTGERTILAYRGAAEDLAEDEINWSRMRANWAYIVPSKINPLLMSKIINNFTHQKTKVAMNPSKFYLEGRGSKLKKILNKLKVLILNREEASYLTGADYRNEREIFRKLDQLVRGIAVMTDGPRGVWVSDGRRLYQAGIFKEKKLIDRTGAGDAFGSGFVAGLAKTNSVEHAIRLASANATAVVEEIGAHTNALTAEQFVQEKRWQKFSIKKF